ncbi:MAG: type II secretion system F family protein [Armatimonadota bacterium]
MILIITVLAFGTIVLFAFGLTLKSERAIMNERIQQHSLLDDSNIDLIKVDMDRPFKERIIKPFLMRLAAFGTKFTPSGSIQAIDIKLDQAGRPWRLNGWEFIGLKVLSLILFPIAGILLAGLLTQATMLLRISLFIFFGMLAVMFPDYLLQRTITERQRLIRKVLPDTLDLLLVSVEAGLGLDGAIQKVTEKMHNPLSDELKRALTEIRVGKTRMDALRDMAKRAQVHELSSFVATVYQADQIGVSISHVLRVQSTTIRTQRAQNAREAAAKLPVKMLFPLVFFIFPAIFIVILAPGAIMIGKAIDIIK